MNRRRRSSIQHAAAAILLLLAFRLPADAKIPTQLSDVDFWKLVADLSEPDGFFPFDNFVSNEDTYQTVIPALKASGVRGGVYVGVGPEQNFSYIAAFQPEIAFIVDIRRQNLVEHLIYKSLFELTNSRAEFASMLFSRSLTRQVAEAPNISAMLAQIDKTTRDPKQLESTRDRII